MLACTSLASAGSILNGWGFNIDGVFTGFNQLGPSTVGDFPAAADGTAFNVGTINPTTTPGTYTGSGTGNIVVTVSGLGPHNDGSHSVIVWLDASLGSTDDGFWFANEYGSTLSVPDGETIWEIDEPGYGTCNTFFPAGCYAGNGLLDVFTGTLSNSNVPASPGINAGIPSNPADISLALGMSFTLAANETARLTFSAGLLSGSDTSSLGPGFYLLQQSTDGPGTYWFKVAKQIQSSAPSEAPEPAAWVLLLTGAAIIGISKFSLRRRHPRAHVATSGPLQDC